MERDIFVVVFVFLPTGPESALNPRSPWDKNSPDPPPDPQGAGGNKKKIKSILNYSWDEVGDTLSALLCAGPRINRRASGGHPTH